MTEEASGDVENEEVEGEGSSTPAESAQAPAGRKRERTNAEKAHTRLRRARKALGRDWTKSDERVDLYLAEANVFALLEVAEVIRSRAKSK